MDKPYLVISKSRIGIITNGRYFAVRLPIFSLFDLPALKNKSLVVGFIGSRGSGKSVNAAKAIALAGLLKGKRVWSNMEVSFYTNVKDKTYLLTTEHFSKLRLQNLDRTYNNGFLYVDEINVEIAEARRSMSSINLEANNFVQELRKRKLSFVWSAQSEMHVDPRLRWQTDIFVKCTDISKPNGPGELSKLEYYDYSGMVKKKQAATSSDAIFKTTTSLNKPWWHIYDTFQLQGVEDEEEIPTPAELQNPLHDRAAFIADEVEFLMDNTDMKIRAADIWARFNIYDSNLQREIGKELGRRGINKLNRPNAAYKRNKEYSRI